MTGLKRYELWFLLAFTLAQLVVGIAMVAASRSDTMREVVSGSRVVSETIEDGAGSSECAGAIGVVSRLTRVENQTLRNLISSTLDTAQSAAFVILISATAQMLLVVKGLVGRTTSFPPQGS